MAHMQMSFYSNELKREIKCQVIMPVDKVSKNGQRLWDGHKLKCLYLLHGVNGAEEDWMLGTRILAWAQERNLAVVMPAGENRFYVDKKSPDAKFGRFIGAELPEMIRSLFPVSDKREDTFIGGLSMGGYGALINGLKYTENFGAIVGLSNGLMLERIEEASYGAESYIDDRAYYEEVFGELDEIKGSDRDYYALVLKNKEQGKMFPDIFIACGSEDFLIQENRKFVQFLKEQEVPVHYEEGPGEHNWEFWDTYIKKALDWLPLEKAESGVNSGNVK